MYARSIVKNDAVAQDVVQDAFISAYKAFDGYVEHGKAFAWLATIARNIAFRHMKRESRYVYAYSDTNEIYLGTCVDDGMSMEDMLIANEGYAQILAIISKLPSHQQTVIYSRFVEGLSVSEVAVKLNIPAGTVKSKMHYGMQKVKSELKNYFIEGELIMDCKKAYEFLYQYAKDAILAEDKKNVAAHLEVCKHCKDIAESLKKLIPQIKPTPDGIMRHYNISFQLDEGMILGYYGMQKHMANYKKLNAILAASNGNVPENEIWFDSGFSDNVIPLAEFDNDGNRVDVAIRDGTPGYKRMCYKKMKQVFEYHQTNSVSMHEDTFGHYAKSLEAPNLYIAKTNNALGNAAKSGLYIAIPGKATNVRMKQGADVLDCGAYKFVYDDRYVTDSQTIFVECTYNL